MRKRTAVFVFFFVIVALFHLQAFAETPATPAVPSLVLATYGKINIKWTAVEGATSYRIMRNDAEIGTSSDAAYADSGLTAGTSYIYKVKAVNADGESLESAALTVKTLAAVSGTDGSIIQSIVDTVAPSAATAQALISQVQNALTLLNITGTDFNQIDPALVQQMISREYELMAEENTDATATDTLEEVLTNNFKNHSFVDVYTHEKLSELAEAHWQKGNKTTALLLYEASLPYLSDIESYVFNTLMRMAQIKVAHLTDDSTSQAIADAVTDYAATLNRFFNYFPESQSDTAIQLRVSIAQKYLRYFPQLLAYDAYRTEIFQTARTNAIQVNNLYPSVLGTQRCNRIATWALGRVNVKFVDAKGNVIPGTLTVNNVSDKNFVLPSADLELDNRTFTVTTGAVKVPVYLGHIYDFTVSVKDADGATVSHTVKGVPHAMGKMTTYDHFGAPVTVDLTYATADGEIRFVVDNPEPDPEPADNTSLSLALATYSKINIKWTALDGINSYKVYRDGAEIATASVGEYADSGLTAGTVYKYKVRGVNTDGTEIVIGNTLTVKTLEAVNDSDGMIVQAVVDMVAPSATTARTLLSQVQSALAFLNVTGVDFNQIDPVLVQQMIDRELELMAEENNVDDSTNTLEDVLTMSFKNHSFVDVYTHDKLSGLAEAHWQKGNKTTALLLYEASLPYLSDIEGYVFNTLMRMAQIKVAHLNDNSSRQEIVDALNDYAATLNRFFDYFPGSQSDVAIQLRVSIAQKYFQYFPVILEYSVYLPDFFRTALTNSDMAHSWYPSPFGALRSRRIASWELGRVNVNFANSTGVNATGTLIVKNVSDKSFVLPMADRELDTRTFAMGSGTIEIPVYLGHTYDFIASFDVNGGNPLVYKVQGIPHAMGKSTTFTNLNAPITVDLADSKANGEINFVMDRPDYPYNLKAELQVDTFALSWDWASPDATYQLRDFKVFRGGLEIGTVTGQSLTAIPLEAGNLTYTYTVRAYDQNGNASPESPMITVLPSMSPDYAAYYAWKVKYFGTQPVYANEDADNDGLSNWQEYLLGSNPTQAPVADPKSTLTDVSPGLNTAYYVINTTSLPNFDSLVPYKTEVRTGFNYWDNYGNVLNSDKADYVGVVMTGYFDAPADGKYRFYMVADDAARLVIDNSDIINMNWGGWHDARNEVYLSKGTHAVRIEYVEYNDRSTLAVNWAGPTFSEKAFDAFWHTADNSAVLGEVIAWQKDSDLDGVRDLDELKNNTSRTSSDSDGDGLSDYEELYIYHTDANAADTDGDGVNDYVEAKLAFTNANAADFNGSITEIVAVNGSTASATSSGWEKSGTAIYATVRNGWVEYDIAIPQTGTYALEVSGTQQNTLTAQNTFNITAYADGNASGQQTLKAAAGTVGQVLFFLPQLTAGSHKIKLQWNNLASNTFLQINSLRIIAIGGPDADANGLADWVDNRTANMSLVTVPATTRTSPVCIEGANANYLDTISVSGFYTASGEEAVAPTIIHGAKNCWYSNVPLNPDADTNLGINFGYCAKTVNRTVNWAVTNVLTETAITVRKGDSLKLAAVPVDTLAGNVAITVDGQTTTTTSAGHVVHKFETAGTVTVNATFTPEVGAPLTGTLTVTVVDASFAGIPYAVLNCNRSWTNPSIPADAALEYDDSVLVFREDNNIALCGKAAGTAYIVARMGENGPVLASTPINVLDVNTHKDDGYYRLITTFDDGSRMVEGRITLSYVPADLRILLTLFSAGTTFEDGTITKWLTAADFDANGVCRYRMLKSPTSPTATCHLIGFYQGDNYISDYRNW